MPSFSCFLTYQVPPSSFNIDSHDNANEDEHLAQWENANRARVVDRQIWDYLLENNIPNIEAVSRARSGKGRWIVIISNDITHQIGSFGPAEDDMFFQASALARRFGIPRIYVSANSGARIGLANEVRDLFKVRWIKRENPIAGFSYLYLTESDYASLLKEKKEHCVIVTKVEGCGCGCGEKVCKETDGAEANHWRIDDVVGLQDGLGVENLKGSGLIAGETSRAYKEIFTLTIVTGRSVGIGAYLVRLGQRCIQNQGPIILTGAHALNKVLGKDVYTSNLQLGGPQIMFHNGVTHVVVNDDLKSMCSTVSWLSYVPACTDGALPIRVTADPVDRDVQFVPTKQPYMAKYLVEGYTGNSFVAIQLLDSRSICKWLKRERLAHIS